jgi:hypothetical protein
VAPVKSNVPPVAALYHRYVPPGAVAVNVAVVFSQIVLPDAVGATGNGLTVTVTAVRGPTHPFMVVCT